MLIDTVDIGVTTKCNANCFSCDRQLFSNFMNNVDMSLDVIKKLIPCCNKFVFIGSFGDFICHNKSLEIIELVSSAQKGIFFDTNAALHGEEYWTKLGVLMNHSNMSIRFNIESLDEIDIHKNTRSKTVINNIANFIEAGGNALIKIIKFKYNENQIPEMIKVFKSMGIKEVQIQTSRVYQKKGPLSPPRNVEIGSLQHLYEISDAVNKPPKECSWKKENIVYVNERGELHPCCHLDGELIDLKTKNQNVFNEYTLERYTNNEYIGDKLIELYYKCKVEIDLNVSSVETAYNSEYIQYAYKNFKEIKKCQLYCNLSRQINDTILKPKSIFL